MKTIYALRIRATDGEPWGEPEYYRTRKERDHDERMNRCLWGIRTHSYEEKRTPVEIEALLNLAGDSLGKPSAGKPVDAPQGTYPSPTL